MPLLFSYLLLNKKSTRYIGSTNRNKLRDTENKLVVDKQDAGAGLGEKGEGIKKHMLPVIKIVTGM